jgi:hypothetical protein
MSAHHSFGYSLCETRAQVRERLGRHDPHPGYTMPLRERFRLPGHEWANLALAISLAGTLIRKGVKPPMH